MATQAGVGILHGVSLSPFVRKVRAVLALKGIEYELIGVMPGAMDPGFLAKSPLSKVPVWEEDGWCLPDSSAICAYLERCVETPRLYPESPRAYADSLFWEEYADTRLVDSGTPIFFQRIVRQLVFKQAADEELVRRYAEEVLPPVLDQLEELFLGEQGRRGGHDDASGQTLSIADVSVWSPLVNLEHAKHSIDPDRWPRLVEFMVEMESHPALLAILEEERSSLAAP